MRFVVTVESALRLRAYFSLWAPPTSSKEECT